jgi:DNA repair ATPase RecN
LLTHKIRKNSFILQIKSLNYQHRFHWIRSLITRQQDELQTLKEGIEKSGAILKQKNVDIQTIDDYKKLEEELEKFGLSMESLQKLVSVLHAISDLECDPQKIVKELARIKSVRQTERRLKVFMSGIIQNIEVAYNKISRNNSFM